jgi:hypothetical protein
MPYNCSDQPRHIHRATHHGRHVMAASPASATTSSTAQPDGGYMPADSLSWDEDPTHALEVTVEVAVDAPAQCCYDLWNDWTRLVDFLDLIAQVCTRRLAARMPPLPCHPRQRCAAAQVGLDPDNPDMAMLQCFYRWGTSASSCTPPQPAPRPVVVPGCRRWQSAHQANAKPIGSAHSPARLTLAAPRVVPLVPSIIILRTSVLWYVHGWWLTLMPGVRTGKTPMLEVVFALEKATAEDELVLGFQSVYGAPIQGGCPLHHTPPSAQFVHSTTTACAHEPCDVVGAWAPSCCWD